MKSLKWFVLGIDNHSPTHGSRLTTHFIIYLIIAVIAVIGGVMYFRMAGTSSYILIIKDMKGQQEIRVNPGMDKVLEIEGPIGKTVVHIHEGKVWISESPCPDKTCIRMGKIPDNGGFIACLPNKVILRALFNTQ